MLWTWLGLCLGRARLEQRGSASPSSRGCRGSPLATHASPASWFPSALGNELFLEIWELHPGGCAFPIAVPIPSHGDLLFSTQACSFPRLFWLKPRNVVLLVVSLHLQCQSQILCKCRISSFQGGLRERTPSEVKPVCADCGKDEGKIHGGASCLAGDQGAGEGAGGVTTLYRTLQNRVVPRQATTKNTCPGFWGLSLGAKPPVFCRPNSAASLRPHSTLLCPSRVR